MAETVTADSPSFFTGAGSAITNIFEKFASNYGTALGGRTDSFGNYRAPGVVDPAIQAQRNQLTGELYATSNPGQSQPRDNGLSFSSPIVLIGAVLVIAALLLRR